MNYRALDAALDYLNEGVINENFDIPTIDFNFLVQLEEAGLTIEDMIALDEGIGDVKQNIDNIIELRKQWQRMADHFVMHKWITRYIKDEKEDKKIHEMYNKMCDPDIKYNEYKKCYKFFCNLAGIPEKGTIIEWMTFTKDKTDKDQNVVNIKYSKGLHVINIPEGMILYHSSPAKGIKELIPTFKSKTQGKYFYPSNRVFFTIQKDINPYKFGLGKGKFINTGSTTKLYKYTPKQKYQEVFMDPTYSLKGEIGLRSVYVETNSPIPVIDITNRKSDVFGNVKGIN
jgi:hypothetical protein